LTSSLESHLAAYKSFSKLYNHLINPTISIVSFLNNNAVCCTYTIFISEQHKGLSSTQGLQITFVSNSSTAVIYVVLLQYTCELFPDTHIRDISPTYIHSFSHFQTTLPTQPYSTMIPLTSAASAMPTPPASQRMAAHSHITGLGLDEQGRVRVTSSSENDAIPPADGLIGQTAAREACGLVVALVQEHQVAGRAVLLVGPPGTGKTALALGVRQALGAHVPFVPLVASQVYTQQVSATAVLMEHVRQALTVRLRETKEVYEGEVTELTVQETVDPLQGASSYGRTISHVVLGLKTTKGTTTLKLDPTLYETLMQEHVHVGDVIYIEANSGAVKRVGRSDSFATEFDLEAETYVPLPKGEVHKKKQVVQDVTLHDLDVANAHPRQGKRGDVLGLLAALGQPRHSELTEKLRHEVNKIVQQYVQEGVAELIPGVLFIDEVHMLDVACFSFLHTCLESTLCPIIIMATNRGLTRVRGATPAHTLAPHGIPLDFLDRVLIVPTRPYTRPEVLSILQVRARSESSASAASPWLTAPPKAWQVLGDIAMRTSLRYAAQLMTPAALVAECAGRTHVTSDDIEQVDGLFLDGKASAQLLQSQMV
jgi:RuvB-like protein 1